MWIYLRLPSAFQRDVLSGKFTQFAFFFFLMHCPVLFFFFIFLNAFHQICSRFYFRRSQY